MSDQFGLLFEADIVVPADATTSSAPSRPGMADGGAGSAESKSSRPPATARRGSPRRPGAAPSKRRAS